MREKFLFSIFSFTQDSEIHKSLKNFINSQVIYVEMIAVCIDEISDHKYLKSTIYETSEDNKKYDLQSIFRNI